MNEKFHVVLLLCVILFFAVLMLFQVTALTEAVEKMTVRNSELDDVLIRYLNGQVEYYEYSLNGLKAYDAERDYVYDYENWCKENFELSW